MTSEPWPAERPAQLSWVRRFVEEERPDLQVSKVEPINSGFLSAAFFVDFASGEPPRHVVIRSAAPKHRAWACQRAAAKRGVACELVLARYCSDGVVSGGAAAAPGRSVEMVAACRGGELLPYKAFMGFEGADPSPELCRKVGRALAKLHGVDPQEWHGPFASRTAYEGAGLPGLPEDVGPLPHLIYDLYEAGGSAGATGAAGSLHSIVAYQLNLLGMVLREEFESVGASPDLLDAEVRRWTRHPVVGGGGGGRGGAAAELLSREVTGHGDLHGGNVLLHDGEPVLIDFETCYVGPAGWDIAHFYQCLRRYRKEHDYTQVSAFARGYLEEHHGSSTAPSESDIEDFLFETMCWWYFANIKQASCLFLVQRLGGLERPPQEAYGFATRTLTPEYIGRFQSKIAELQAGDATARRDFARSGLLDL